MPNASYIPIDGDNTEKEGGGVTWKFLKKIAPNPNISTALPFTISIPGLHLIRPSCSKINLLPFLTLIMATCMPGIHGMEPYTFFRNVREQKKTIYPLSVHFFPRISVNWWKKNLAQASSIWLVDRKNKKKSIWQASKRLFICLSVYR
jgi:hypothetical protein